MTRHFLSKMLILMAMVGAFVVSFNAQVVTSVLGQIVGTDGKGVEGAEIKFERTDIKANYQIKTNREGKFNYATLPQGIYNITVLVNGNTIAKVDGLRTNPAQPYPLNIDMRNTQPAPQQAAEDAKGPTPEQVAEFEKQKKEYEEALLKDKALQEAFNLAMQARTAKDYNAAIDNFIKASQLDPNQDVIWANLADTYTMRAEGKRGAAAVAEYALATDAYAKAVALKPTDPSLHNNYATVAARAQKIDIAQAELAKAIELDQPGAAKYYRNLARVYFDTNQPGPAETAFKKAIELDPKNPEAHYQLGLVLIQSATLDGDKLKAPAGTAEAFQKYLELAPTGPQAAEAKAMLDTLGAPVRSNLKQK